MTDGSQSTIIQETLIVNGLDPFCVSFVSICEDRSSPCAPDALASLAVMVFRPRLPQMTNSNYGADLQNITLAPP